MSHELARQFILGSDESVVLRFLKNWPDSFVSETEVARRADSRRRFQEDPGWASDALAQLTELKLIEADSLGRFRVNHHPAGKCVKTQRFVSPRLREILKQAGYCAHCTCKDCSA